MSTVLGSVSKVSIGIWTHGLRNEFPEIPPRFRNYHGDLGVTDKVINTMIGDLVNRFPFTL